MDDAEFIAAFEAAAIPREEWTHRAHIRMAYCYLRALPFDEAVRRVRAGIQRLNAVNQVPEGPTSGYHETLTIAWLHIVKSTMVERGTGATFEDFAAQQPHLLCKTLPRVFYSARGMPPESKHVFVAPDLTPFPGVQWTGGMC